MLQVLHKILAFIIAIVVLLSALSFTYEKPVSEYDASEISYYTVTDSCNDNLKNNRSEASQASIVCELSCCTVDQSKFTCN